MKFNLLQIIIFSLFSFNSGFNSCLENSIIINYSHSTHIEGLPSETVVNSSLVSNNVLSIYEMDYVGNSKLIDEEDGEEGGVFLSVRSKNNPKIFLVGH